MTDGDICGEEPKQFGTGGGVCEYLATVLIGRAGGECLVVSVLVAGQDSPVVGFFWFLGMQSGVSTHGLI